MIYILERQLHVAVLVIVIDILPPIMHGKKLKHSDAVIPLPVFHIMHYQYREFE